MKIYKHFTNYLKSKNLQFNESLFNSDIMYRAKIFNQYHRQYKADCGETIDFASLEWEVEQYEEKLYIPG